MAVTWKFGLCDLAGVNIGEVVNAYDRTLNLPLNSNPTAQFRIRLDDPLADEIISRNGDCLVKVYQDTTLRFIGDILTMEEGGPVKDGEGVSITVTAAGPLWRLSKRLMGIPVGTPYTFLNTAAETIIQTLVDATNVNHHSGIEIGTLDTLYATNAGDNWAFKPISEGITEMQAAQVAFPIQTPPTATHLGRDDFSVTSATLAATTPDVGTAWTETGEAGVFSTIVSPGADTVAYRATNADVAQGRFGIIGMSDHASVTVGVNWQASVDSAAGTEPLYLGVVARQNTATDEWIRAGISFDTSPAGGAFVVQKKVGATVTQLATVALTTGTSFTPAWYAMVLSVDSSGNWAFWHWATAAGFTSSPAAFGQDDDLATGGALDTGKSGIWDMSRGTSVTIHRYYDSFVTADHTGSQSFDFELAPKEPTGTPAKIADLNIRFQIGTSKPEVIFEYGSGNRSSKSYKRVIDRNGLLNQGYVLPTGDEPTTDIRAASDFTSVTARGLFQEIIPSDFGDSQLRQALADAHVAVRKVPRHVITFEPSDQAPVFGTDFIVGDFVTGRGSVMVNGVKTVRFNALFRVYGVEISVNDEGKADVVPSLVPA